MIICDFATYRNYICFEHTTYLFEFSERFGPAWFTIPGDEMIDVEPNGHMSFLWDMFEEWVLNKLLNLGYHDLDKRIKNELE